MDQQEPALESGARVRIWAASAPDLPALREQLTRLTAGEEAHWDHHDEYAIGGGYLHDEQLDDVLSALLAPPEGLGTHPLAYRCDMLSLPPDVLCIPALLSARSGAARPLIDEHAPAAAHLQRLCRELPRGSDQVQRFLLEPEAPLLAGLVPLADLTLTLLLMAIAADRGVRVHAVWSGGPAAVAGAYLTQLLSLRDSARLTLALHSPSPQTAVTEVLLSSVVTTPQLHLVGAAHVMSDEVPHDQLAPRLAETVLGAPRESQGAPTLAPLDDPLLALAHLLAQFKIRTGALPERTAPSMVTRSVPSLPRLATEEVGAEDGPALASALQPAVDAFLRSVLRITQKHAPSGPGLQDEAPSIVFTGIALADTEAVAPAPSKLLLDVLAAAGHALPSAEIGTVTDAALTDIAAVVPDLGGPVLAAQPSTTHALVTAADWLRAGRASAVVVLTREGGFTLETSSSAAAESRPVLATLEHTALSTTVERAIEQLQADALHTPTRRQSLTSLLRGGAPDAVSLAQQAHSGAALALIRVDQQLAQLLPPPQAPDEPIFGFDEGTEEATGIPDILDQDTDAVFFSETLHDDIEDISDSPSASLEEFEIEAPLDDLPLHFDTLVPEPHLDASEVPDPFRRLGPFSDEGPRLHAAPWPTRRLPTDHRTALGSLWPTSADTSSPSGASPWTDEDASGEFTFPDRQQAPVVRTERVADDSSTPMLYRPRLAPHRLPHGASLAGHGVLIVGTCALAEAIRTRVKRESGRLVGPYSVVVDVDSGDSAASIAKEAELEPGLHWIDLRLRAALQPHLVLPRSPAPPAVEGAQVTTLHACDELANDDIAELVCRLALASESSWLDLGVGGLHSVTFEPMLAPKAPAQAAANLWIVGTGSASASALVHEAHLRYGAAVRVLTESPTPALPSDFSGETLHVDPTDMASLRQALEAQAVPPTHLLLTAVEADLATAILPLLPRDCVVAALLEDADALPELAVETLRRGPGLFLGAASWTRFHGGEETIASLALDLLMAGERGELWLCGDLLPSPVHSSHPWVTSGVSTHGGVVLNVANAVLLSLTEAPTLVELLSTAATALRPGTPIAGLWTCTSDTPADVRPLAAFVEVTPVDAYSLAARVSCLDRTLGHTELAQANILLELAPDPEPLPPAIFPDQHMDADQVAALLDLPFPTLTEVDGLAQDGLIARALAAQDPSLNTAPSAIASGVEAAQVHAALVLGERRRFGGVEAIVWERDAPNGEHLEITVRHRGERYDVDVLGPDGPILHMRGLDLVDPVPQPDFESVERPLAFSNTVLASDTRALGVGDDAHRDVLASADYRENADAWLDKDELAELCASVDPDDLRGHIAAHIAAKRALAELVGAHPADVRLPQLEGGHTLILAPHGELAVAAVHAQGHAYAMAGRGGRASLALLPVDKGLAQDALQAVAAQAALTAARRLFDAEIELEVLSTSEDVVVIQAEAPPNPAGEASSSTLLSVRWSVEASQEILAIAREAQQSPPGV